MTGGSVLSRLLQLLSSLRAKFLGNSIALVPFIWQECALYLHARVSTGFRRTSADSYDACAPMPTDEDT